MSSRRNSTTSSSDTEEEGRVATGRRDENSISFRHFLQPQSDVVPTRHRPPGGRSGNDAPVDLVDIPRGLPDFVQDHLVVEAQSSVGEGSHEIHPVPNPESPLDLALINELMPNLLNSSQRHTHNTNDDAEEMEELGAYGPAPGGTPALPDFLSDGPMHYDANASSSETPSKSVGRFAATRCPTGSLGRSHSRGGVCNTDSLLQQIQRLEREIQERDRRIAELENVVYEQKAELMGLYELMAQQQQDAESKRCEQGVPWTRDAEVRLRLIGEPRDPFPNGSGSVPSAPANQNNIREIATRAESLIEQLMVEIRRLKRQGD